MKASDLREKSVEDLSELQKTLARDLFQNRLKNFTNRLDDTSAIRKTRRDLARVITLLRERSAGIPRKGAPAATTAAATTEPHPAAPAAAVPRPSGSGDQPTKTKPSRTAKAAPAAAPSKPAKTPAAKRSTTTKATKKDEAK